MTLLNVGLLKNPLNWVTIFLMVAIGLFGADRIIALAQQAAGKPAS